MAGNDNGPTSKSLFDKTLTEDEPIIQQIIGEINALIDLNLFGDNTTDHPGNVMQFYYDTNDITKELPPIQTNRVVNSVIKYYRMKGIRITTANLLFYEMIAEKQGQSFDDYIKEHGLHYRYMGGEIWPSSCFPQQNHFTQKNYILCFVFYIRSGREYMKSYV